MKIFIIIISFLFLVNTISANDTISINQNQYFIDSSRSIVLTNKDVEVVNTENINIKTHVLLNEFCSFLVPVQNISIGNEYLIFIPSKNAVYSLYFTELPIVIISTPNTIIDESNVLASFKMIEKDQRFLESDIGIQFRGSWSQTLLKKSMEIEFWTDSSGDETQDHSLLGMVNDDDWNLQAMYNEPLRIRSKTNNDLWRSINTLDYQDREPDAINGIRMNYIELFLNDEYKGLYCLGEKVNRKQLKLKKHNGSIRGELYKGVSWGASTFFEAPPFNNNSSTWSGFEYKHPEEELDWRNIHTFVDFVVNASDEDFFQGYQDYFNIDNLVDYYIFLNLLRATDNTGKNIYIAKYNSNDKYFYVPWDLDGTFGTIWDGTNENVTNDLCTNGLYARVMLDCRPNGFKQKLKDKWISLRSDVITHDSLMALFSFNNSLLESNGVYRRETLAWNDYSYNINDLDYMSNWIVERIRFLDDKFTEDCPDSSVDKIASKKTIKIFPNPTSDQIFFDTESESEFKVSVLNNLGQVVFQQMIKGKERFISMCNFEQGVYYFNIESDKTNEIHKIILTK